MAWCFWKERRRQRVLHEIPFSVQLIHSLRYESEEAEATKVLDIDHLIEIRKCFLDLEEKTKSRWKCLWGDQALCKREIRHRDNLGVAAPGGYENDSMLYDILMQSTVE
ncbi:uncharacterized protein J4E79_002013 [Alternaria viburni]|uniref:uncharacterized protein n=1 Tax=Alternaria viburni TaxID=566460 RepID=UPI0020C2A31B|nr:uncharacterized protein J4E79_002013 [Alternaria viburni]KAI4667328.1 hypothetical protein J4E79_002013 [Alternaria viburni]